jgi:DNA-binding MurR/RpiR family transcriptional regulator
MTAARYHSFEALRDAISAEHATLSSRLHQIATFALEHPTDMALETIAVISRHADVQPSALIRFAKKFGYSGFSDMQKTFQTRVVERSASYKERIRSIEAADGGEIFGDNDVTHSLLIQYCRSSIASLNELMEGRLSDELNTATDLLEKAENVYIVAQRRSFPIAAYLGYALNRADCRTHLLDGGGGMVLEYAQVMRKNDVLVAITFPPYSSDTAEVVAMASKRDIPVIVMTDSPLSPVSSAARAFIEVHDAAVHSFHSLTASMCIAQTLVTALAYRNKKKEDAKS